MTPKRQEPRSVCDAPDGSNPVGACRHYESTVRTEHHVVDRVGAVLQPSIRCARASIPDDRNAVAAGGDGELPVRTQACRVDRRTLFQLEETPSI